jgi:hypothetical protein
MRVAALPLLLCALPAAAQDLPARKPDLWELTATQTVQSMKSAPQVSWHCIDAETDKAMQAFGLDLIKAKCDRLDWRREGKDRVLYAGCLVDKQPIKVFGVATGDLETNYTTTLTITRIGRPEWSTMPPETVITSTAKWIGARKLRQRPGDMTLANGMQMNIKDEPRVARLLPPRAEVNLQTRKAGLWELRSTFAGDVLPPQSQKQCVSAELDRAMITATTNDPRSTCTQTVEREGDAYVLAARCTGTIATSARAVISGDFERALEARITVRRQDGEPIAPGLPSELIARQDQRRLSDCTADMRPGDVVTADGTKTNVGDRRAK